MCSVAQSVKRYGRFADAARESLEYIVNHLVRAESRPLSKELGSIAFSIPCILKHLNRRFHNVREVPGRSYTTFTSYTDMLQIERDMRLLAL